MTSERRFYVALGMYALLAVLVWTTLSYTPIRIEDRVIDFRVIPSLILGMFALRTVLFRHAERIHTEKKLE